MSDIVNSIKTWRFAILYFSLYSINSLGSVLLAALTGTTWSMLDGQSKFLIGVAIMTNWTNTILSFVSKAAKKVESGQPLFSDTTFIARETTTTTKDTNMKPQIIAAVLIAGTLSMLAFSGCIGSRVTTVTPATTNALTGAITGPITNTVFVVDTNNLALDASAFQVATTPFAIAALQKNPSDRQIFVDIQTALAGALNGADTNVVSTINGLIGGDATLQSSIAPLVTASSGFEQTLLSRYGQLAAVQITVAILKADLNIVNAALKAVPAPVATPVP